MANDTIQTVLSNFELNKLNEYITTYDNDTNRIETDSSLIFNNIETELANNSNIFNNQHYFDLITDNENYSFNIYKLLSNDTNINLIFIDFMIQFYKEIKNFITDNNIINDDIYTKNFRFEFKTKYKYVLVGDSYQIGINDKDYTISFCLNKDFFENRNSSQNFYISDGNNGLKITNSSDSTITVADVKDFFKFLFNTKNGSEKLKEYLDFFVNKKTIKYYYTNFETYKLNLNNYILKCLYITYKDFVNTHGFDSFMQDKYNKYLNKINEKYEKIKDEIIIINEKNNFNKNKPNESEQIKSANKTINKLKELNENLEHRYKKINTANNNVSYQQTKLNYIKSILVLTIIIFVISSILLLSVNYLRKYTYYENGIYITIFLIILIYAFIFWYINSLKKFNKNLFYEYFTQKSNDNIFENSNAKITSIRELSNYINTNDIDYYIDYYDTINPLLNIELKNYKNKEYNSRIYDKVAHFNMNISNRDIKYNIETINYLITLTILLILIFIILYKIPSITYITGTIGILLFLFISIIYFARIIRIVRTKSYNYYWNKPLDTKKIGNDLNNN